MVFMQSQMESGEIAFEEYEKQKPELILLDIMMPGITGIEVIRKIKQKDPKQKIIMVTSIDSNEVHEECTKLSTDAYLHKPFEFNLVTDLIKKFLN